MVQQIDVEMNDYSENLCMSDVEETLKSAVDDFPDLSKRIKKLSVFVFDSKQIEEGFDVEKMRSRCGLPREDPIKGWGMMVSYWNEDVGLIEVKIEEFRSASETHRKFIARHELGHIFLSGPPYTVALKDISIDYSLKDIVDREVTKILTIYTEYKVNSLMMRMFPELAVQDMNENPAGFSRTKDREILDQYQVPFEKLLVAIRLIIIYKGWLAILERAPSSLREKVWESIRSLHSERIELLKRQALEIHPELRDVPAWFTEEHLENPELLVRRALELSLPS